MIKVTKPEGYNFEAVIAILTPREKAESKDAVRCLLSVEHLDPATPIILDFRVI